jgi:hypothetical protein
VSVSSASSRAAHSHAHLHAIRGRKFGNADNSEERAKGNPEDRQGGDSGRREYLRDVSSQQHSMRKPKPDSVPWKRRRNNISSEDQELISSAVTSLNKFSDDGSFMEKISDLNKNKKDSTGSASADEQRDREQKHFKESSEKAPLMGTQKLNANQLAAKILQLRMKGKIEEAEQLSVSLSSIILVTMLIRYFICELVDCYVAKLFILHCNSTNMHNNIYAFYLNRHVILSV